MRGIVVVGTALVTASVVAACTGASSAPADSRDAASPATPHTTVPLTGPAVDLAPSQRTAATVPRPATPPPCDPSELAYWTAQVQLHEDGADAVVRVRNDGADWCEVDVSGSPAVDPLMEPDVWLEPGAWADLVVGPTGEGCDESATVTQVALDVNGRAVAVATAAVVPCAAQLVAFFPNVVSDEPCGALDAVAVDGAIVVRNVDVRPCRLGRLVTGTGEGVTVEIGAPETATPVMAGGDVVAFEVRAGDGPERRVELGFDSGASVEVTLTGDSVQIVGGAPQPWIGGPGGPSAADGAALLAELDPFGTAPSADRGTP